MHVFLTSVLGGGEWSASRAGRFTHRERVPSNQWKWGWVGPRGDLDDVRRENSWPYRDSNYDPSVIQPLASRYTDVAITVSEITIIIVIVILLLLLLLIIIIIITWGWKQVQSPKRCVLECSLEYGTIDEVQKCINRDCHTVSSKPFRIYSVIMHVNFKIEEHCAHAISE
jgi:hypothetical protein